MTSPVHRLELKASTEESPYGLVYDIYIDGENLLDRVTAFEAQFTKTIAGAYAPYLRQPSLPDLLVSENRIMPYACDCGEPGCWFLTCTISTDYGFVRWHGWKNPYRSDKKKAKDGLYWRYRDFPDLVFEETAYRATVESALADITQR